MHSESRIKKIILSTALQDMKSKRHNGIKFVSIDTMHLTLWNRKSKIQICDNCHNNTAIIASVLEIAIISLLESCTGCDVHSWCGFWDIVLQGHFFGKYIVFLTPGRCHLPAYTLMFMVFETTPYPLLILILRVAYLHRFEIWHLHFAQQLILKGLSKNYIYVSWVIQVPKRDLLGS